MNIPGEPKLGGTKCGPGSPQPFGHNRPNGFLIRPIGCSALVASHFRYFLDLFL